MHLVGVACPSATTCEAVGGDSVATFTNGTPGANVTARLECHLLRHLLP